MDAIRKKGIKKGLLIERYEMSKMRETGKLVLTMYYLCYNVI